MASLTTRSDTYYIDFYDSGREPKRKRLSLKTESKAVAERLKVELEDAYAADTWDPWIHTIGDFHGRPAKPKTLEEGKRLYMEAKREADLSEYTLRLYKYTLDGLLRAVGKHAVLERLTAAQIGSYTRDKEAAQSTRRTRHSVVKSFLKWLRLRGYLQARPMKLMKAPKEPSRIPRAIRPEQLEEMITALKADYKEKVAETRGQGRCLEGDLLWHGNVWRFALHTGLRLRELARLRWRDVDTSQGLIYLHRQKSGKGGTAPLAWKAAAVLEEVRGEDAAPDEYVFTSPEGDRRDRSEDAWCDTVTCTFSRYREAAGLEERLTFHSLRHGFCTMLAEAGKSAHVIKAAARHADITTSMRYVHLSKRHLKQELEDAFS